ncbi:MAG: coproporphyrinogen III oxidase, partial [Calditrichaeota bacterium]|nr:coproporphyrinogen III oxidase [Calditrichota bacterium]
RKADVRDRFGIDFDDYFAAALPGLAPFIEDELLSVFPDRIQVHEDGRLVIRNIAMVFDAYLQKD